MSDVIAMCCLYRSTFASLEGGSSRIKNINKPTWRYATVRRELKRSPSNDGVVIRCNILRLKPFVWDTQRELPVRAWLSKWTGAKARKEGLIFFTRYNFNKPEVSFLR
jgi:hypothetical protein